MGTKSPGRAVLSLCLSLRHEIVRSLDVELTVELEARLVVQPAPLAPAHLRHLRLGEILGDLDAHEITRLQAARQREQTAAETDVLDYGGERLRVGVAFP